MIKISAIIIAGNAEEDIVDCIKSVSFCDEIIVVSASTKGITIELARQKNAKIVENKSSDFAERRNAGLMAAKGEWVLYIDTDERVTPSLREEIKQYINNPVNQFQAFRIKRKNFYLGKNEWPYIEKLERLFWRKSLREWKGELHETAIVSGNTGDLEGYLEHYTHKDLTSMLAKTILWSETEARLRLRANHPKMSWWRFPRVMLTAFYNSYITQSGWKAGVVGIIESMYQAFSIFVTYARLWELQERKNKRY